jgi:ADP-ribose pyrophosphatase YjhB (NUDIX family)
MFGKFLTTNNYLLDWWSMRAERHNETLRPGIAVMVVMFNERKEILLGRRSSKVGMGTWVLPGGKVDLQESTLQAAE